LTIATVNLALFHPPFTMRYNSHTISEYGFGSARPRVTRGIGVPLDARGARSYMKRTRKTRKAPSAESIARMAGRGQDVSRFFTNRGKMMQPIQRVNVGVSASSARAK
jgi:hypothetical protein